MSSTKPVLTGLLDDMLDPELLAKLQAKRAKLVRTDLSDLIVERPKPLPLELLQPTSVIFHAQENTCTCGAKQTLPLGLVAMHPFKRNGRLAEGRIGIPLQEPNDFPILLRERDITRTSSKVCAECVDDVRFAPRSSPPSTYVPPQLNTPQWDDQFGYASTDEIRAYEERLRRAAERERHEEDQAEKALVVRGFHDKNESLLTEESLDVTSPEDTE